MRKNVAKISMGFFIISIFCYETDRVLGSESTEQENRYGHDHERGRDARSVAEHMTFFSKEHHKKKGSSA